MSDQELQLATFDLNGDLTETDDFVIVKGKIFEAGDYPDKNFSITEEELAEAVANFKPVPVDYSHVEGPLDGKLGEMKAVSIDPNNKRVALGEVAIPKWLDKVMGPAGRKVSCTWNRATKQIEKLALVNQPRIEGAVLYAAFVDDQLEKYKAHEDALFEGKRNSAADHKTIQAIHDHTASLGAKCSGANDNAEYSSDTNPTPTQQDKKELDKPMSEETKVDFKDSVEFQALQSQFAAQQAEIERLKADKRHALAESTVKDLFTAKKIISTERASLTVAFEKALEDDAKYPEKVTFGQGQEGTRFDVLLALFDARPENPSLQEMLPNGGTALFSSNGNGKKDEVNADRIAELKKLTPMGRATLSN